ncbi:protein lateral organ boundaries [Phtheirospermum japonicum]|uniref:Protein lateral organ boundaries n=1 Tax=Phtheirospermum japonicum TaxID=374723 RepID=A0A830DBI1_9LAMI|nr:protein lateral organ boundaries [Phtheirospermum japonicum]
MYARLHLRALFPTRRFSENSQTSTRCSALATSPRSSTRSWTSSATTPSTPSPTRPRPRPGPGLRMRGGHLLLAEAGRAPPEGAQHRQRRPHPFRQRRGGAAAVGMRGMLVLHFSITYIAL